MSYVAPKGQWIVDTKGGPGKEPFEISVVRSDNEHGRKSYGWFDKDKLLISHNGGPCRDAVTESIWKKLVAVAEVEAKELNAQIKSIDI